MISASFRSVKSSVKMPFATAASDPKFGAQKLDESDIPEIRVKTAFNG